MFHIAVQPRRRLIAFGTQVEFLKNHKLISWLCIKFLSDCCWTCWYVKLLCSDEAQLKRRIVMSVQNASPVGLLQQVVQHCVGYKNQWQRLLNNWAELEF
jgi:hypothetical protein